MKCVCPSGGDRTCPDSCLLAVWHGLSTEGRKAQRKAIAEGLYKQNYTMEYIATQLGVSHPTIVRDLKEFVHDEQTQPRTSERGRKGEGRPKGSGKKDKPQRVDPDVAEAIATARLDEGKSEEEIRAETGVGVQLIRTVVAREQGRREAEPTITPDMLSLTAQQKLEAAIKQHKKKLDAGYWDAVQRECRKHIEGVWLPSCQKRLEHAQAIIDSRTKGVMPRSMFKKILACLHPDSRKSTSEERLNQVFNEFEKLELILCSKEETPVAPIAFPRTWEEAKEWKRKVAEARRAKRQANGSDLAAR
jgi:transposase